jgi:CheY-like chemotaxis protein
MLAFSRQGKWQPRLVALNEIVLDLANKFQRELDSSVALITELAGDLPPVQADKAQMQLMLMHLIRNAAEACAGGGTVTCRTDRTHIEAKGRTEDGLAAGEYVRLVVEDDGEGMRPETLARAFEPMFSTRFIGRGMGLAAAYGIALNHGGRIALESEPGMGTRATVLLPCSAAPPPPREMNLPGGSETLLLVDDEEMILRTVSRLLSRLGYEILTAEDGETALEILEQRGGEIHLVVLDLRLPGMGGHELYDPILRLAPAARVLVSSGYEITGVAQDLLDRGAAGFLQKPYRLQALAMKIRDILDEVAWGGDCG